MPIHTWHYQAFGCQVDQDINQIDDKFTNSWDSPHKSMIKNGQCIAFKAL